MYSTFNPTCDFILFHVWGFTETGNPQMNGLKFKMENAIKVNDFGGTPILLGFSLINHPFGGTSTLGHHHIWLHASCVFQCPVQLQAVSNALLCLETASLISPCSIFGVLHAHGPHGGHISHHNGQQSQAPHDPDEIRERKGKTSNSTSRTLNQGSWQIWKVAAMRLEHI